MIFTLTLLALFLLKSIGEDSWICTENGWIQHGKPNSNKPTTPCGKIETELVVKNYLKENISTLSPSKEVLGGKFYITKIEWIGDNSGIVEYEDGHIALKATFDYIINVSKQNNDYSVIIKYFKITNQF
jgi:hypothetical protein